MRVILEVVSGPQTGSKVRLVAGQVLQVGRTEWADFAVPADNIMSSQHFSIEAVQGVCQIKDVGSSNGTFVNGQQTTSAVLRNGDEILAGQTRFKIHIEGDSPTAAAAASVRSTTMATPAPVLPSAGAAPRRAKAANYTVEPVATGLTLFRGEITTLPASIIAGSIAQKYPLYLIVDFNRLQDVGPIDIGTPEFLFDWIPESVVAAASPVLIGPVVDASVIGLIDQAWGEDALVCIFSLRNKDELLSQLRTASRAGQDSVLGYCWPSVLGPLLSFFTKSFIQKFMTGIDAILVEFADLPETWQIFARADFESALTKIGLQKTAAETSAAT